MRQTQDEFCHRISEGHRGFESRSLRHRVLDYVTLPPKSRNPRVYGVSCDPRSFSLPHPQAALASVAFSSRRPDRGATKAPSRSHIREVAVYVLESKVEHYGLCFHQECMIERDTSRTPHSSTQLVAGAGKLGNGA